KEARRQLTELRGAGVPVVGLACALPRQLRKPRRRQRWGCRENVRKRLSEGSSSLQSRRAESTNHRRRRFGRGRPSADCEFREGMAAPKSKRRAQQNCSPRRRGRRRRSRPPSGWLSSTTTFHLRPYFRGSKNLQVSKLPHEPSRSREARWQS